MYVKRGTPRVVRPLLQPVLGARFQAVAVPCAAL